MLKMPPIISRNAGKLNQWYADLARRSEVPLVPLFDSPLDSSNPTRNRKFSPSVRVDNDNGGVSCGRGFSNFSTPCELR